MKQLSFLCVGLLVFAAACVASPTSGSVQPLDYGDVTPGQDLSLDVLAQVQARVTLTGTSFTKSATIEVHAYNWTTKTWNQVDSFTGDAYPFTVETYTVYSYSYDFVFSEAQNWQYLKTQYDAELGETIKLARLKLRDSTLNAGSFLPTMKSPTCWYTAYSGGQSAFNAWQSCMHADSPVLTLRFNGVL